MKLSEAVTDLSAFIDADIPVFLWGPPGIGKSDIVRQEGARRNWTVIDLRALLLDPVDLRGLPVPAADRSAVNWIPAGFLPNEKRDGANCILFLDELNAAPPSVQAACYQLVLDRRVGEYTLPKGCRIVSAGNRATDRAVVQKMPTPLKSRFAHIEVEIDLTAWHKWAASAAIHPMVRAFLRLRPELLHKFDPNADAMTFPAPRTWEMASRVADSPMNRLLARFTSVVGHYAAEEFYGFASIYKEIPDIRQVLTAPDSVDVPTSPNVCYAVATALATFANRQTIGNAWSFCKRFNSPEYGVVMMNDAVARDETLRNTSAYSDFAITNQHMVA